MPMEMACNYLGLLWRARCFQEHLLTQVFLCSTAELSSIASLLLLTPSAGESGSVTTGRDSKAILKRPLIWCVSQDNLWEYVPSFHDVDSGI